MKKWPPTLFYIHYLLPFFDVDIFDWIKQAYIDNYEVHVTISKITITNYKNIVSIGTYQIF